MTEMSLQQRLAPSPSPRGYAKRPSSPAPVAQLAAMPAEFRYATGSVPAHARLWPEALKAFFSADVRPETPDAVSAAAVVGGMAFAHRSSNYLAPDVVTNPGTSHEAMLELEREQARAAPMQLKQASPAPQGMPIVAQLKVHKQKAGHWYSDLDPYKTFATKEQAAAHDKALKGKGVHKARRFRVPTMYTYTHTKVGNRIGHTLQGPHTVAHRLILRALQSVKTMADVKEMFDNQVLTPGDVDAVMQEEAPDGGYSTALQGRVDRALAAYRQIHTSLSAQIADPTSNLILAKHRLNKLMNLDPYATYGWKSMTKASKKSLRGKGENVAKPTFDHLLDRPSSKSIRNADALDSFVDARKALFNLHFT
jgi:hypothetical protein